MTVTGTESYLGQGLAVAIVNRFNKPKIVVNLPASEAEGSDLDARLLALAEVLR